MKTNPIKRPNVLHIITGLNMGGAEQALHNLLAHGLNEKFNNKVISLTDHGHFSKEISGYGIKVDAVGMKRGSFFKSLKKLTEITKEFKPEIIQGWMYHGNVAALYASKFSSINCNVVWNIRHSLHNIKNEKTTTALAIRLNKYFSKSAALVIYNSNVSKQQHQDFGLNNTQSLIHPNGFDTELFKTNPDEKTRLTSELNIEPDNIVIGNVARFHPMKNHLGLVRVAVKICSERDDVTFVFAGNNVTYKNKQLSDLIPENMRKKILLLDEISNMSSLMKSFDIYVQSSKWGEAFPNALAEAMATEIYCIATDIGDSRMIVADTGQIFSGSDDDSIHKGLLKALKTPLSERLKKGSDARNRIKNHFSIQSSIDMYANTYENLIK